MFLALREREQKWRRPLPAARACWRDRAAEVVGSGRWDRAPSTVSGWAQVSGSWSGGAERCLHYRVLRHFVTASQKVGIFLESVRSQWRGERGLAEPPPWCWHSSWVWNAKTQTECSQFLRMRHALPGRPHLTTTAVANKKSPGWYFPSPWPGG